MTIVKPAEYEFSLVGWGEAKQKEIELSSILGNGYSCSITPLKLPDFEEDEIYQVLVNAKRKHLTYTFIVRPDKLDVPALAESILSVTKKVDSNIEVHANTVEMRLPLCHYLYQLERSNHGTIVTYKKLHIEME